MAYSTMVMFPGLLLVLPESMAWSQSLQWCPGTHHSLSSPASGCKPYVDIHTLWLCQNSYWKWTIYSGFTHWKWWFSIVMLVYQRVNPSKASCKGQTNLPISWAPILQHIATRWGSIRFQDCWEVWTIAHLNRSGQIGCDGCEMLGSV